MIMSIKRIVASLLIAVMIFSFIPVNALTTPVDQDTFVKYLGEVGIRPASVLGKPAWYPTYSDKFYNHLVVYGTPWSPEGESARWSDVTQRFERRYLGWTQNDQPYTNTFFPNDKNGSKTPLQWNYEVVNGASTSWTKLATDTDQKNFMRTANLSYNGTTYAGLTANWIGTTNANKGYYEQTKLQNAASWKNGFSVYTQHYGADGKLYYATFNGPEMGGSTDVNGTLTTPSNTYTIKADQQSVTVPVTVTANASLIGPYVKATQIEMLNASFEDSNKPVAGLTTTTTTKNKILDRTQYTPGTHPVTLSGYVEMQSKLSDCDKYIKPVSKTITLIVEPNPTPYVEVTATANPSSKQVDGSKEEPVTVTVNAKLIGYKDTSNIKSWTIYAKLDGEEITLQQKDTPGGTLTSSAGFSFTVVKSKFNVDSFLQSFKVTATARLNHSIDDTSSYSGTTYTTSHFYKSAPPEPEPTDGNIPPVAVLYAPETLRAGDEAYINGLGSYDEDGTIVEYMLGTSGANVTDSGEGYANVWYPYTGMEPKEYQAALLVKDNAGDVDTDFRYITVTEPTIKAKISVGGRLKTNRLVKIINGSDSPDHYPIDSSKTVWSLQAVSGGTNADIKFNGVLTGVDELQVIFKRQGVYKATLSVTNTAGFTATTEKLITVGPDLAPVANFETATTVLRDVNDYGNASIELFDTSYSLDADTIGTRIWSYAFDSDNDGSFTDEVYNVFDNGNNTNPVLKTSTVGKYHIKLQVKETFSDTLPLYILPADYLTDESIEKPIAESVVEVANIAPSASFSMIEKKKVDLVFNIWDTKYSVPELQTKINNTIVPALAAENIDANITIADNYDKIVNTLNYNVNENFISTASTSEGRNGYETVKRINLGIPTDYTEIYYEPTTIFRGHQGDFIETINDNYTNYSVMGSYAIGSNSTVFSNAIYASNNSINATTYISTILRIHSVKIRDGKITLVYSQSKVNADDVEEFIKYKESVTTSMDNPSAYYNAIISEYQYYNKGYQLVNNFERKFHYGMGGTIKKINDYSTYMNELLLAKSFRENSKPYLVTISDNMLEELADPERAAKVLSQTLEKNISFVGLGTINNKTQLESFITSNNNNGTFIDTKNIDTAITALKDYIVGVENQEEPKTQYVVMGEDLEYLTFYDDYERDIKNAEQWVFNHTDPNYFDNPLGLDPQSGQILTSPITRFNKVGVYDISLKVQDNPYSNSLFDNYKLWSDETDMQLFVHRRPVASFTPYIMYNSDTGKYYIDSVDKSYDPDHNISRVDKGITEKQWKWKETEDVAWQTGQPADIVYGKTYMLQLMVKDIEGAWSLPAVETVLVPDITITAVPPIIPWQNTDGNVMLSAIVNKGTFSKINYIWTKSVTKPASGWTSSTIKDVKLNQTQNGEWYLHAEAFTAEGQSKYIYFGPYQIDKIPPSIIADKAYTEESSESVTVYVAIADEGGSGLKDAKYAWSKSETKPTSGWVEKSGSFSTTQDKEGLWYLHIEAADNAKNVTYSCLGTYEIKICKLENFRIVKVRDFRLEDFYYNAVTDKYDDKPMNVSQMAVDATNFAGCVDELTRGYKFEFEIDSKNFNEAADTIVIEPHFYTADGFARDSAERELYWEDSNRDVYKAGQGGHAAWKTITLTAADRTIKNAADATWRGKYLIPATSWAVPMGTANEEARSRKLKRDIIVSFNIKGYKNGVLKFDYNQDQWPKERTNQKYPYQIGDVIRYSWERSYLDDIRSKDNR